MPFRFPLIFLLLLSLWSKADGIVMKLGGNVLKPAELPQQIGVISHDGKKETLTIWNTVRAENQDLAWVLPLPAPPEVIQQTAPEAIRWLQLMGSPPVEKGGRSAVVPMLILVVVGVVYLFRKWLFPKNPSLGLPRLALVFCVSLAFSVWSGSYSNVFGTADGPTASGVRILSTQEVGNYETTVITGDSADGIKEWRTKNGFPDLGKEQQQTVQDYLGKHWVFLCAKLKVPASGVAAIHPLTVRFPSREAIYPMRLTQAARTVPVSLYCVDEQWMTDPSGRMKPIMATYGHGSGRKFAKEMADLGFRRSANKHLEKNPALAKDFTPPDVPLILEGRDILLDGLFYKTNITHLEATFGPESNWDDVRLVPSTTAPAVPRHMTIWGLVAAAWDEVWWIVALVFLVGCILYGRSVDKPGWRAPLKWFLGILILVMIPLGIGMIYVSRNSVIVSEEQIVSSKDNRETFDDLLGVWLKPLGAK